MALSPFPPLPATKEPRSPAPKDKSYRSDSEHGDNAKNRRQHVVKEWA